MTRLEISVCQAAIENFSPWNPSVKTCWHTKMTKAIEMIVHHVLNDENAICMTYRRMSLPRLIAHLCGTEDNILAVGKRWSWIVNAQTGHKQHFVGTRGVTGISTQGRDTQ